ncbi:hypothetical protein GIJ74_09060 [Glaesserella parasuis]|uniref:hypothetical protein n=1 Tax=Glaesserella parasuis TaxID=738 RepID=UPI000950196C|nr:hypothetical protein [Glaesserella parasuis]MDG6280737.1 hypothetical protein [Glaesserella parasuis]MDG6282975.1 hypothetical protein [Glaesserella parasuis]MDG6285109.1 hypothetical protein [Glaesserella parasuis]MDG6325455.1 hypothetical protein [Glaesserella parasuis]MDG6359838.1 hypothetical protein [Glaesserella parasuis]
MKKSFTEKAKSLKDVSLAMGIFTSFFSQEIEAYPKQSDVLQVINQVKKASTLLTQQSESQTELFFAGLKELTQGVSLLNAVVRSMKTPEKVIDDLIFIDLMLNKLVKDIRQNYYHHFQEQLNDRATFKDYMNEVASFNLFTITLRQELGHYMVVPSTSNFTQADLDELIVDSNRRYGING